MDLITEGRGREHSPGNAAGFPADVVANSAVTRRAFLIQTAAAGTQIHEATAWTPAQDPAARAFQPQIAPKWLAKDGKSFWLVWSDVQTKDEEEGRRFQEEYKRTTNPTPDDMLRWAAQMRRSNPYYAFNAQRVDLILG